MKKLLFGWITKGQYQLSFLDIIIALIEIFLISGVIVLIKELLKKFKHKKEE